MVKVTLSEQGLIEGKTYEKGSVVEVSEEVAKDLVRLDAAYFAPSDAVVVHAMPVEAPVSIGEPDDESVEVAPELDPETLPAPVADEVKE